MVKRAGHCCCGPKTKRAANLPSLAEHGNDEFGLKFRRALTPATNVMITSSAPPFRARLVS